MHHANAARLRSLATQMSYRLDEGHGACLYRIGVEDDGCHSLLDYCSIAESARLLECIARSLNAVVLERKMIQNEVRLQEGTPVRVRIDNANVSYDVGRFEIVDGVAYLIVDSADVNIIPELHK